MQLAIVYGNERGVICDPIVYGCDRGVVCDLSDPTPLHNHNQRHSGEVEDEILTSMVHVLEGLANRVVRSLGGFWFSAVLISQRFSAVFSAVFGTVFSTVFSIVFSAVFSTVFSAVFSTVFSEVQCSRWSLTTSPLHVSATFSRGTVRRGISVTTETS